MADRDARNFLLRATLARERVASLAEFPFTIPAIGGLHSIAFERPVTFLVGENGAGKSTLLEAIAVGAGLNHEGGSRNFTFSTRATHSPILLAYPHASIFLMAGGPPRRVAYRETEHYTVTRSFLTRTEQMLDELLGRPRDNGQGGA